MHSRDLLRGLIKGATPPRATTPTVVHVTTVPVSLATHLAGQVGFMRGRGFTVHVVTSPGPELDAFAVREPVSVHAVPMARAITPAQDLVALWALWRILRRVRPDIVHSHTPKGGLLGMIAAALAGAPVRIYHIRGLPFVTATGLRRIVLRLSERVSCALAHRVLAVSGSMRAIAVEERLCPADKVKVLLGGSGNGVDSDGRFRPATPEGHRSALARLGLPSDAVVVGFVGRFTREKGVCELAEAWSVIRDREPRSRLLLVGWHEARDAASRRALSSLQADPRVHAVGAVADVVPLYAAMDVVALPTYREGFPNVALEAAACALPIVATSVPGCTDAVQADVTGLLVPPGDGGALAAALLRYLADPSLRAAHGEAARRRVVQRFCREAIWQAIEAEYLHLLGRAPMAAVPASATAIRS